MGTSDERMQILKMIQEKQITAEEGAKLLAALKTGSQESSTAEGAKPRWFRVRITDMATGKHKVNMSIPMSMVNVGLKMGARFVPDQDGIDLQELAEAVRGGKLGKVIEIENEEGQERIEIFAE